MTNILTNLIRTQHSHYGSERVAYNKIDLNNKALIPTTWGEFSKQVANAAAAMEILEICPAEMVAIFAPNCPEIIITDFAAYANRAVPVSIYATSSPEQVAYIVNDCHAKMLIVGNNRQYRVAREIMNICPSLKHLILVDSDIEIDKDDRVSMTYEQFLELGAVASPQCRAEVEKRTNEATEDDIATLIYTSGTTGESKGAILTHSCIDAAMLVHRERLHFISDRDTSLCFLPLSHIFEKAWSYFCLYSGIEIYINRNTKRIQEAVALTRPTCMCSVPRFWEKVYTAVQEKMSHAKGIAAWMMNRAIKIGTKRNLEYARLGIKAPLGLELKYRLFDRLVLNKVRAAIGVDNGHLFPTAGAPLSARIVEFLHACGINICIGYGLSETTATVSCFPEVGYKVGTVGTLLPMLDIKIGENSEILLKGPTIMKGYYGRPEETAKALSEDGWFHTGDAGLMDESGALVLTERLKDLFKTSNGKYIAPQAIESRLGEDRYIEQVAVIGDSRKYVTALIIPAFGALKEYALNKKIEFNSIEELVENSEIKRFISERIERLQKGLAGFEKIKKFTLLPREFSIESGELTNTLKIRRAVINTLYSDRIEAMYV